MPRERSFRALDSGDVGRIGEITVAAWEPIYAGYREALGEELFRAKYGDSWLADKASRVRAQCLDAPEQVRVVERDGAVVGFVTFQIDEDTGTAEIGNSAIDPEHQGRGLGPWMYGHVLELFAERDVRFAEVETGLDEAHTPARRAYRWASRPDAGR